ncbi:hypothetical protein UFOVP59_58 [uncultured Caudovirales phage]|uniref:Uncharacterized protein n=1 Tax=uncultured Caudovirales phage TaxID=2100421 RepID=A0A6J5KUT9_9CAUD|nr:hypothetical protein UFOVP59_58 [uncultured Caudovirales phage]CAB5220923.1 hypothetical protein UFOVP246_57 [uncultured Caudovirales phage]
MKTQATLILSDLHAIAFEAIKVPKPKNKATKATDFAFGNSYRRVYKDKEGLFAIWYGKRVKVYMTTQVKLGGV